MSLFNGFILKRVSRAPATRRIVWKTVGKSNRGAERNSEQEEKKSQMKDYQTSAQSTLAMADMSKMLNRFAKTGEISIQFFLCALLLLRIEFRLSLSLSTDGGKT